MSEPQSISPFPSAPRPAQAPRFDCEAARCGDVAWIRAAGELDLDAAPQLEQILDHALASAQAVYVDLRGLTFMDSTGVHLLVEGDARSRRGGSKVVLVSGSAPVDRLLRLAGVSDRLEMIDPHTVRVADRASIPPEQG